jgi:DNA-binding NarL/FixJ family response regulator
VFIVDDHPIVRMGLRSLLDRQPGLEVCGDAETAPAALDAIENLRPDIVLADLALPGIDGLDLVKQLASRYPEISVLVVSMHDETLYARRAIAAGASGYVMKGTDQNNILQAIERILRGEVYLSDAVRTTIGCDVNESADPVCTLTDRELQIFRLLGEGHPPREIADALVLSVSTVEKYRERLKMKLGLESSTQLTRYAIQWTKSA